MILLSLWMRCISVVGVTLREKVELTSYQLKDVTQILFTHRRLIGWYFPREKREVKVEEFINLTQGRMSVQE